MVFECQLLGDDYLIAFGERYHGRNTLKCLQELMQGGFEAATSEEMQGLREIEFYVGRPSTGRRPE